MLLIKQFQKFYKTQNHVAQYKIMCKHMHGTRLTAYL